MLYQFHVNKMKSLRRITRCLYEGSVFNTERAASSRRWQHTSRFSITVPCTNVADLIMKDFGKFSNKVALVSTLWLFMYRIYTRSYNLLEDIIKDIDVSNGNRSLKLLNSWRHNFFSSVGFYQHCEWKLVNENIIMCLKVKRENLIIAESFVVSNFLKTVLFCTSDFAWFKIYEEHRNFSQIDGVSGKSLTYGELEYEVVKYAEYFRQLGINKGDVVCICGSNVPQFAHVFLAGTGIRAAVTIANGQLTPRKQTFIYLQSLNFFYKIEKNDLEVFIETCFHTGELTDQLNVSRAKFVFATEDTLNKCREAVKTSNHGEVSFRMNL